LNFRLCGNIGWGWEIVRIDHTDDYKPCTAGKIKQAVLQLCELAQY